MPLPDERVAWEGEEDEGLWRDNEEEGGGRWPEPNKLVVQETVNPSSATGAK